MERTRTQDLEVLTELRVENRALADKLARTNAGRGSAERYMDACRRTAVHRSRRWSASWKKLL